MTNPDQNDILITETNSEMPQAKKPNFFWMSMLWRTFKISLKYISNSFFYCTNNLLIPTIRTLSETISKKYQSLKSNKEKTEILAENYLKAIESKMNLKEARLKIKEVEAANILQDYERKIKSVYDERLCNASITIEKNESNTSLKSLDYGLEVYEFISDKLKESCLVANIEYMNVTCKIEKQEMVHMMEFELKISGQSWASIFAKYISTEVFKKIEWADGKIDCHHLNNVTLIRDTFILTFTHKRLELLEVASPVVKLEETFIAPTEVTLDYQNPESSKDL